MNNLRKLEYEEILAERKTADEAASAMKHPITVILYNIRSMYNVGSFFRTCDSAFVKKLILTGYTPFPPRKEIEKTALGSTNTVDWEYELDIINSINKQRILGNKIFAVELTNKKRLYDTLRIEDFPLTLVFGNELTGIPNEVIYNCDDSLEVPMFGLKHSLNVSVSGGIVIYEAVRTYNLFNSNLQIFDIKKSDS